MNELEKQERIKAVVSKLELGQYYYLDNMRNIVFKPIEIDEKNNEVAGQYSIIKDNTVTTIHKKYLLLSSINPDKLIKTTQQEVVNYIYSKRKEPIPNRREYNA